MTENPPSEIAKLAVWRRLSHQSEWRPLRSLNEKGEGLSSTLPLSTVQTIVDLSEKWLATDRPVERRAPTKFKLSPT